MEPSGLHPATSSSAPEVRGEHEPSEATAIWLVEDDRQYAETLVYLLNHTSGLQCEHVFFRYEDAREHIEGDASWDAPGVVLMDVELPGTDGIEATRHLKGRLPEVPILMLTIDDAPETMYESLRAGASGYLLKDTPLDRVVASIREAVQGGMLMPAPVADKVLRFFNTPDDVHPRADLQADYGLTPREREVLHLMTDGLARKQIADRLALSPHTIDNHLRSIYRKLHVRTNLEAAVKAVREGLL